VTFGNETQQTESADGQNPNWGSSHSLEFTPKSVDTFDSGKILIEIYETKNNTMQASVTIDSKLVPQGGKMVATLRKEIELEPEGQIMIEAWCSRL
jgi:hypothetical protein